jgi:hypothetical protein
MLLSYRHPSRESVTILEDKDNDRGDCYDPRVDSGSYIDESQFAGRRVGHYVQEKSWNRRWGLKCEKQHDSKDDAQH